MDNGKQSAVAAADLIDKYFAKKYMLFSVQKITDNQKLYNPQILLRKSYLQCKSSCQGHGTHQNYF